MEVQRIADILEIRACQVQTAQTEAGWIIVLLVGTKEAIESKNIGKKRREERVKGLWDMSAVKIWLKKDSGFKEGLLSSTNLQL